MLTSLLKAKLSLLWKFCKKYRILFLLSLCVLVGFLLALPDISSPMIAEGDAYSRVNVTFRTKFKWLFTHHLAGTWLSLHFFLMKTLLFLFPGSTLSLRLLTLITSLCSIVSIYFYTYNLKKEKDIALISAFLFSIYPLRVALSTQTLSEPIFLFLFITSLVFITKEEIKFLQILVFSVLINIAHGIRYESWIALPFIWLLIALSPSLKLTKKISLLLATTFFPIYWVIGNYLYSDQFLNFFKIKYDFAQRYHKPEYFNLNLTLEKWGDKLISVLPLLSLPIPLIELISFKKSRLNFNQFFFYLFPFYLFFALIIQVYLGTMEWMPLRYLLIPVAFYLPLIASGIYELVNLIKVEFRSFSSPIFKALLIRVL